jgi:hypothetical protein
VMIDHVLTVLASPVRMPQPGDLLEPERWTALRSELACQLALLARLLPFDPIMAPVLMQVNRLLSPTGPRLDQLGDAHDAFLTILRGIGELWEATVGRQVRDLLHPTPAVGPCVLRGGAEPGAKVQDTPSWHTPLSPEEEDGPLPDSEAYPAKTRTPSRRPRREGVPV